MTNEAAREVGADLWMISWRNRLVYVNFGVRKRYSYVELCTILILDIDSGDIVDKIDYPVIIVRSVIEPLIW